MSVKYVTRANASWDGKVDTFSAWLLPTVLRALAGSALTFRPQCLGDHAGSTMYFPHLLIETCPSRCCVDRGGRYQGKERTRKDNEAFTGLSGTPIQIMIPLSEDSCHKFISLSGNRQLFF